MECVIDVLVPGCKKSGILIIRREKKMLGAGSLGDRSVI